MTLTFKKNNATLLHFLFIIWFAAETMFSYSAISRFALLAFVGVSILVTRGKHWSYYLTAYLFVALWSVANIAFGHAVNTGYATKMTQTLFLNLLFLYAFVCYCRYVQSVASVLNIFRWLVAAFCVPCLLGGIGTVFSGQRLSIMGLNSNVIAIIAAYACIIFANDMFASRPGKQRRTKIYVIILLLTTILLTGSRKGLIIPAVGIYSLICVRKPRKFVLYSLAIAAAATVVLFLIINVDVLYNVVGYRVEAILQYLAGEEYNEVSLASRSNFILLGWMSSQDSLFWGHGLDCFRTLRYSYGTYSHNNYIEILYSLGWVGVVIYYMPYLYTFWPVSKQRKKSMNSVALSSALLIPFIICDYMNVTYFTRTDLIIPLMAMLLRGEKRNETIEAD